MSPRLSDLFLSSQSDERLVSLARAGHERAFVTIVERYRGELHALARRLCSDGRAEDVVQQTFLSAFAALSSGAEVKHLRGWLYAIARNEAIRSRAPASVPLDPVTACAETVEEVVQQRAVAMDALTELGRLPRRQREAMIETVLGGMPRAEVASTMGLSEGAVRQLVHRARAALRTVVTAVTPWPVARWFAAMHPTVPGTAELTAGAGAAPTVGVAIKLGALLASGTLVTGAAVDLHRAPAHHSEAHPAARVHARASTGEARGGTVVSDAHAVAEAAAGAGTPRIVRVGLRVSRSMDGGATGGGVRVGGMRRAAGAASPGARHEGKSGHRAGTGRGGEGPIRHVGGEAGPSSAGSRSPRHSDGGGQDTTGGGGSGEGGRRRTEPTRVIASSGPGDRHGDQPVAAPPQAPEAQARGGRTYPLARDLSRLPGSSPHESHKSVAARQGRREGGTR